jgi:hypothetical protein
MCRCLDEEEAVAEAEAGARWRPGCGGWGGGGQGATARAEAGGAAGRQRLGHDGLVGDARGQRPGPQSLSAAGGWRASGGGGMG